jgi:hypothetical protein
MSGGLSMDNVDAELAEAFGRFALTDAELHEAAAAAGVTRWELEDVIRDAGLDDTFEIETEGDVSETIDDLLDGDSS